MNSVKRWTVAVFMTTCLGIFAGCHRTDPISSSSRIVTIQVKPSDPWVLISDQFDPQNPPFIAADGVGVRFGLHGDSAQSEAVQSSLPTQESREPLPLFVQNHYSKDEKILPFSNPVHVFISINGEHAENPQNYFEKLDLRNGILSTSWVQSVSGQSVSFLVQNAIVKNTLISVWTIRAKPGTSVQWIPSPRSKNDPPSQTFMDIKSSGNDQQFKELKPINASVGSLGFVRFGEGFQIDSKLTSGWPDARQFNKKLPVSAVEYPIELLSKAEKVSVKNLPDIEIDGPIEDQQAIRSFIYYLRNGEGYSVSPMGLSSATYDGHTFWDADIWIMPALYFLDPEKVSEFENYRLNRLKDNPTDTKPGLHNPFPWESSVTGAESTQVMSREFHVNGDVLLGLRQCQWLGIAPKGTSVSALNAKNTIANTFNAEKAFWRKLISPRTGGGLDLKRVTSPDENHTGDNDLYTNLLAQWTLNGMTWRSSASQHLFIPSDAQSLLTYENDPLRGYKQAAAILSIYPLQYPPAESQANKLIHRFVPLTLKNGPAMSDSVAALIEARSGNVDSAYKLWRKSWQDFVKTPLLLFSEKRQQNRTYFFTGAGGSLQTVLYGFLGARLDEVKQPRTNLSIKLRNGGWLSFSPHLPLEWKSLTIHNFVLFGKRYKIKVDHKSSKDRIIVTPPFPAS